MSQQLTVMRHAPLAGKESVRPAFAWMLVIVAACAVVSLALSLQAGVLALLFAAVAWWVWLYPVPGFYLFIVLAPILPMFKITQTIGTVTLLKDVIILTLVARLVAVPLWQRKLSYRRNILLGPLLLLVLWVMINTLRADVLVLGILRARDIVLYALMYIAVLYLPKSKVVLQRALLWFVLSACIVAILGAYQFVVTPDSAVLRFDPAREIWIPRVSSVMAHPSIFGQYLVSISALLGALVLTFRRQTLWWVFALAGIGFLPLIYLTYSRAVWLGYLAAVGLIIAAYVWSWYRARRSFSVSWQSVGVVASVGLILAIFFLQFTNAGVFLRSAIDPTYGSNLERLEFLSRLIAPMSNIQALVGLGLGDVLQQNLRSVNVETYDIASGASRAVQLAKNATLVDNQYLKTFVEMGLAGLLIYGWLYWRLLRAAVRMTNFSSSNLRQNYSRQALKLRGADELRIMNVLGLWGVSFLAAFVVQAFFIDIWDIFPTNAYFWIVAALVSAWSMPTEDERG